MFEMCVGFSPNNSGVFSVGNGPAMRAAVIGAAVDDVDLAMELNCVSSRITHTDPVAEVGAAVAGRRTFPDRLSLCGKKCP